ncbi:MAG TPA: iron-sulfur cluster assembly accessory protein [Edaphocola sp.]|nr:iron-sulfur cluster assembly accessory protein [Edaphocola sp.]
MEGTVIQAPVRFTAGALKELKRLMSEPSFDNSMYLRVGVKGGGCSGLSYVLAFDKPEEDDDFFEVDGVKAMMKKSHGLYLTGMEIDFSEGLNARGFVFNNPNASTSCGCGSSFGI